jgi:BON domain
MVLLEGLMRLQTLPYVVLATLVLAAPACGRGSDNTAVGRTLDRDENRPAGTAGRAAPDIVAPTEDGTITMKIQAKYASDDVIRGRNIDIDATNGVVTLKGQVDSRRERDVAEQLARETDGVKRVIDDLKVAPR